MKSQNTFKHPFPVGYLKYADPMLDFVKKYWFLNRSAVNPDTDKLAYALKKLLSGSEIIEAKSGEECLTWIIPQRWHVRHAYLKTVDGKILADYSDNPLYLWSHCVGYKGKVGREELLKHVVSQPSRSDEIFYHDTNGYRYGVREWGFSLPHRVVESLNDEFYYVDIDADLDDSGTIKVVDCRLPGNLNETMFFMAHTCHPAQVSDGLACIAVCLELCRFMTELPTRRYTYRFIFGPEYFAAATFLAKTPKEEIDALRFGCFLDMLSNHEPVGYQCSFQGDSLMDKIVSNVIKTHSGTHLARGYRRLWGNDETFYNGPEFRIPTIGIGRGMHREYHYNTDNLEHIDHYHMVESLWILQRIIDVLENDVVVKLKFKGPIYLSRYGLLIDPREDYIGAHNLQAIMILMDGTHSCMDIADKLDVDYFYVRRLADILKEKRLAELYHRDPKTEDLGSYS